MPPELVSPSLATREWWALSENAAVTVLLVEVELRELSDGRFRAVTLFRDDVTSIGTTKAKLLNNNPNRLSFTLVVMSANRVFLLPDQDVSTTAGLPVQITGGSLTVEANEVKLFGPASARPAYYDRNPTTIDETGANNPGAALLGITTQWTYTVPANRAFYAEFLYANAGNLATMAINGLAIVVLETSVQGGGFSEVLRSALAIGEASRYAPVVVGGTGYFEAADALRARCQSNNNAAASDVDLKSGMKGTEFDA